MSVRARRSPDVVIRDVQWIFHEDDPKQGRLVYIDGSAGDDVLADQLKDPPPVLNLVDVDRVCEEVMCSEYRHNLSPAMVAVLDRCIHPICPHATHLQQFGAASSRRRVHRELSHTAEGGYDVSKERCWEPHCTVSDNLWMCLHCGHVGCGKIRFGHDPQYSKGGNGHASNHRSETPSHALCVKLGTITKTDADVHCYLCEVLVQNPYLAQHLRTFSIDRTRLSKLTAKKTFEWYKPPGRLYCDLPVFTEGSRSTDAYLLGLPEHLFWYVLKYLGNAQSQIRYFSCVSRACHLSVEAHLKSLKEIDLSSSPSEHAHQLFSWHNTAGLLSLTWRKLTPTYSFAFPMFLQCLDTLCLPQAVFGKRGANAFCSLFALENLRVLCLDGCDGDGLWGAVDTFNTTINSGRTLFFKRLEFLDVSGVVLENLGKRLGALLVLTQGKLKGLKIGHIQEMAWTMYDSEQFVPEALRVVKLLCPQLEFFEFVSEPVDPAGWVVQGWSGAESDPTICGMLLQMPCLRYLLCRPCVLSRQFVERLPAHLPRLEGLDLLSALRDEGSSAVTLRHLTTLLQDMPHLAICPPVAMAKQLRQHDSDLAKTRLIPPVSLLSLWWNHITASRLPQR